VNFQRGLLPDLILTFRSLAALLEARFPLVDALDECAGQAATRDLQSALSTVCSRVTAGQALSDAMAAEPAFPQLVIALTRTGESSGTLSRTLTQAADILELKQEGRRNLSAALTYPAVIMGVTLLATLFLAAVIAPQVGEMYRQLGQEMPLLTRMVIYAGYLLTGLLALVSTGILIRTSVVRSPADPTADGAVTGRSGFGTRLLRRIPLMRAIDETHGTALWTFCLHILLQHRIPLPEALDVTASGIAGSAIRRDLMNARQHILSGESPGAAFSQMKTAPALARRILQAGDRSGDLPEACRRVHGILDSEYRNRTRRMLSLVEPVAVLIAGCLVILVAMAVILPIAELGGLL